MKIPVGDYITKSPLGRIAGPPDPTRWFLLRSSTNLQVLACLKAAMCAAHEMTAIQADHGWCQMHTPAAQN